MHARIALSLALALALGCDATDPQPDDAGDESTGSEAAGGSDELGEALPDVPDPVAAPEWCRVGHNCVLAITGCANVEVLSDGYVAEPLNCGEDRFPGEIACVYSDEWMSEQEDGYELARTCHVTHCLDADTETDPEYPGGTSCCGAIRVEACTVDPATRLPG